MTEVVNVINTPSGISLIVPGEWCHFRGLILVSAAGRLSTQQYCSQISLDEWYILLSSCIISIPATMAILFEPIWQ